MKFDVVTAFPGMLEGPLGHSIVRRARERGLVELRLHDLRDYASDKHRKVDDTPYGGGGGMVLMPGPLFTAADDITRRFPERSTRTILLCPQGEPGLLGSLRGGRHSVLPGSGRRSHRLLAGRGAG